MTHCKENNEIEQMTEAIIENGMEGLESAISILINEAMKVEGAGYCPSEHVLPLILMLNGGGRSLEDLRQIKEDRGLRELLDMRRVPSSDAVGDWLRRYGENAGLQGLARVNRRLLERGLKGDGVVDYPWILMQQGLKHTSNQPKGHIRGIRVICR